MNTPMSWSMYAGMKEKDLEAICLFEKFEADPEPSCEVYASTLIGQACSRLCWLIADLVLLLSSLIF